MPSIRHLMLTLTLFASGITFVTCLYTAKSFQEDILIQLTLESNQSYAFKVSSALEQYFNTVSKRQSHVAQKIATSFDNISELRKNIVILMDKNLDLAGAFILNKNGKVIFTYPEDDSSEEIQSKLTQPYKKNSASEAGINIVRPWLKKEPFISISTPITDKYGNHLGTLYTWQQINSNGVLWSLINTHELKNSTNILLADANGKILFNRSPSETHEHDTANVALLKDFGSTKIIDSKNSASLAGFAILPSTNWYVIVTTKETEALAPIEGLKAKALYRYIPIALSVFLIIWIGTSIINHSLIALAEAAKHLTEPHSRESLLKIKTWCSEHSEIRSALISSLNKTNQKIRNLKNQAETDSLTGLANRRALNEVLASISQEKRQYSILSIDIDYFKKVNDTFGHDIGDEVLKQTSSTLKEFCRDRDLVCRVGGEEFLLLLPETEISEAKNIAERIRTTIEHSEFTKNIKITVSIGAAQFDESNTNAQNIIKLADERLYISKRNGRNRVTADS